MKYTDPSGQIIAFTNMGYEFWKTFSPIAIKIDIHLWGSEQQGIGFDVSVGIPKMYAASARVHFGATYYTKYYDNAFTGWEFRKGSEFSIFNGFISVSNTKYKIPGSKDFNQTTTLLTFGNYANNIQYENDFMWDLPLTFADNGDRWRSGAVRRNIGNFSMGTNFITGEPGFKKKDRDFYLINGHYTYKTNSKGDDPDKYRAGVLYFSIGNFKAGINSEQIRHIAQNRIAHDWLTGGKSKWFKVLDRDPEFYFYFGTGTGNSLW
jgi:hypothetical protein